jgi:hypothetical protein
MTSDRRRLISDYKETPRPMGVGVVRNTINGKVLVVCGRDLPSLLNRHRAQLRFDAHRNRALQEDWRAHGEAAFQFEVVDTLPPSDAPGHDPSDDLAVLERLWLEKLAPYGPAGYNRRPRATGSTGASVP